MSLKTFMSALMLAIAVCACGVALAAVRPDTVDQIMPSAAMPLTATQRPAREAPAIDPQVLSLALAAVQGG